MPCPHHVPTTLEEADNVFYHLTYEGAVDVSKVGGEDGGGTD